MSKLRLFIPDRIIAQGLYPDTVPTDIIEEITNVDVLFNHSILMADLWSMEYTDALTSINEVYQFAAGESAPFVKEDFEDLLPLFKNIRERLSSLIDTEGKLENDCEIPDEKYFEIDEQGRLRFISHKLPATYFLQNLQRIIALFDYALQHKVSVDYISE